MDYSQLIAEKNGMGKSSKHRYEFALFIDT